jgi:glucosamine-6-phosphate deaminase
MEVIIKPDANSAGILAAKIIAAKLRRNPDAVIGFATGSTPLGLYDELVRLHKQENLSFSRMISFNLDEYLGLGPEHPRSFYNEMYTNLFGRIDVKSGLINIPDGKTTEVESFCADYEAKIKAAGGIDLQLLGIGDDGHLAFNEPGSSFASRTRLKTLSQQTIQANSRFFNDTDEVPRHVITMGLATIMSARICLLLAFGEKKAEAVRQMVEGPVSASWPATILQHHEKAIVILDEAAASDLKRRQYYKDVYEGKPAWQAYE